MKKWMIVVVAVLVVGAIGALVIGNLLNSPEYALKKMVDDINANGFFAIRPYLSDSLQGALDKLKTASTGLSLLGKVTGATGSEALGFLQDTVGSLDWSLGPVTRGGSDANVTLNVSGEAFTGEITLVMTKSGGNWVISNLSVPLVGWSLG
ncbi:MAG: hypothetical protein IJ124_10430 [Clostridia bacterium]|nr:hypothetical protein [Clostridia bacterium]